MSPWRTFLCTPADFNDKGRDHNDNDKRYYPRVAEQDDQATADTQDETESTDDK